MQTDGKLPKKEYHYTDLLQRCFDQLQERNPNLMRKQRFTLPPPAIRRLGRKVSWDNFPRTCQILCRPCDHVQSFVLTELGASATNDGAGRLVIRGRYDTKQIESVLKKYILAYVTCAMCRSVQTSLTRDAQTRLQFVECGLCGSKRSVAPIKAMYRAVNRGERRAARMRA
mmetsp:Transcript_21626/g.41985  ORF Transcript_21626/g.41985 Transcript_21626/m.41985 type:complete len:171 (-) Transcript_21626:186-698(-)